MKKILYFKNYKISSNSISFKYKFNNKSYTVKFTSKGLLQNKSFDSKNDYALNKIICYLGIISSFNLFDLEYFDEVIVECIALDKEESDYFSDLSFSGLAEFRYINKININKKIKFSSTRSQNNYPYKKPKLFLNKKTILLNGGGKDSAVAAEILKLIKENYDWLTLNMNIARKNIILTSKIKSRFSLSRVLDKNIRKDGKYLGHKPVSALLAFISILYAYVYKYSYVVTANEHSSNFSNLKINNILINHQYTKSLDFEKKFNVFIQNKLFEGITYYSILRPLYEIQITKIFSSYEQYFSHFISCNTGVKENKWCLKCPKCAFIFLALAPFISITNVKKIWGSNLFLNKDIIGNILKLIDDSPKPFDCVGTKEECRLALYLCEKNKFLEEVSKSTKKELLKYIQNYDYEKNLKEYLQIYKRENNIPKVITSKVEKFWKKTLEIKQ